MGFECAKSKKNMPCYLIETDEPISEPRIFAISDNEMLLDRTLRRCLAVGNVTVWSWAASSVWSTRWLLAGWSRSHSRLVGTFALENKNNNSLNKRKLTKEQFLEN